MDDSTKPLAPSAPVPSHWVSRVLIAVLLAEGIWGLIVSLTRNLIVPFLARQLGGDPQSPLYLGKGDFDIPAVFVSLLELCFAGIVAAVLNAWVNRGIKTVRVKTVRVRKVAAAPAAQSLSITPPSPPAVQAVAAPKPAPLPPISQPSATTQSVPQPKPASPAPVIAAAKPAKPKPPKEVYYNIVGEPINPTEDD